MAAPFFDLVRLALPSDLSSEDLMAYAPESWWKSKNYLATAYALRKCPRINWEAYQENYQDVKKSGIDPCLHFIRHGVHEGRKLRSWNPVKKSSDPKAPLVSIIIPNYNNETYLEHCIESTLSQTLEHIEIIIVDDASSDGSAEIIKRMASTSNKIRVIWHKENAGTHMARKSGVLAARGRFVMFLDADDFLASNACEIAYSHIVRGYDIVAFDEITINRGRYNGKDYKWFINYLKRTPKAYLEGQEMLDALFNTHALSWQTIKKIYLREIIQVAFNDLKDGRLVFADDPYGLLGICKYARNILKVDDKLYYYNYGAGVSQKNNPAVIFNIESCNKALISYAIESSININTDDINSYHCKVALGKLFDSYHNEGIPDIYKKIAHKFGLMAVSGALQEFYAADSVKMIKNFLRFKSYNHQPKEYKNICLYFQHINIGGTETILLHLSRLLRNCGYRVVIFTEGVNQDSILLGEVERIITIKAYGDSKEDVKKYVHGLASQLKLNNIDLMINFITYRPYIIWDIVTCDFLEIPLFFSLHTDQNQLIYLNMYGHSHHFYEDLYKCSDLITCLSRYSELYFRAHGINAVYVPNPVPLPEFQDKPSIIPKNLVFVGRLGDPVKQVNQLLLILIDVLRIYPNVKLYLVGGLGSVEQENEFRDRANRLGLNENIIFTGWTQNVDYYLRQCSIFVSTSFWEGFPMGVSESLAIGLPCVIYDLPIELANNNPALITVPQGDYTAAAREIVKLFDNPTLWRHLSKIARASVALYTPDRYASQMIDLINTFDKYCVLRYYTREDYEILIKSVAWYAQRPQPKW